MNFSVLLSVYHKENPEFLDIALRSIWEDQTVKPAEIVIVKDGPLTPELDAVIDSFTRRAPAVIVPLEKNQGLGKALAIGLEKCSYSYVARMDTDDIALPDRFEKQIAYLTAHPETDILGSAISEFIDHPQNIYAMRNIPLTNNKIHAFCKKRSPFNHVTLIYKKDFILDVGNYQHFLKYEDYWLWIRCINAGAVCANLPDATVNVRAGKDMLQRRRGWALFTAEIELIKRMREIQFISFADVLLLFFCRAIPRLFPVFLLKFIYRFLR